MDEKKLRHELASAAGERLREARLMEGLTATDAAELIGFDGPNKLLAMEAGKSCGYLPIWMIKRASEVYCVSTDWLVGITESMEPEPGRPAAIIEMLHHLNEGWEIRRRNEVILLDAAAARLRSAARLMRGLTMEADELEEALERVIELNGQAWQAMDTGRRLTSAIDRVSSATRVVTGQIQQIHGDKLRA